MASTVVVTASNAHRLNQVNDHPKLVCGTINLGNPYAADGVPVTIAQIQTAINTAFGSSISGLTTIASLILSTSVDGLVRPKYVSTTGKVMAWSPATSEHRTGVVGEVLGFVGDTDTLANVPVAGSLAININAAGAGIPGAANITNEAPILPNDIQCVWATGVLNSLAASAVTAGQATYEWIDTAAGLSVEYGAVDLSAAVKTMDFIALVY